MQAWLAEDYPGWQNEALSQEARYSLGTEVQVACLGSVPDPQELPTTPVRLNPVSEHSVDAPDGGAPVDGKQPSMRQSLQEVFRSASAFGA